MDGEHRRQAEELHGEVAVRDGVQGIGARAVEAERLCRHPAVDGKRRAGQGRRAEGALVEASAAVGGAAAVAPEHLHVGQQVVSQGHRLRRLEMGEAGHHGPGVGFGLVDEDRLQARQRLVHIVQGLAQPQAQVGGHLVVARARRVQAPGGVARQLGKTGLHVHVDVLERPVERKPAFGDLLADGVQTPEDGIAVRFRYDALTHKHGAVRLGRGDVLGMEALVHVDGDVDRIHEVRRRGVEPPAAHRAGARRTLGGFGRHGAPAGE